MVNIQERDLKEVLGIDGRTILRFILYTIGLHEKVHL